MRSGNDLGNPRRSKSHLEEHPIYTETLGRRKFLKRVIGPIDVKPIFSWIQEEKKRAENKEKGLNSIKSKKSSAEPQ